MVRKNINAQLRMVGYGRVSTDEEKQLDSLENQILFFTQFAESRQYKLMRVYADEGISGKQLKKRDEFQRMLSDAEYDLFDVVVVKDVSRFARNTVDLLTSIRKLKARGINVLFVNNSQETMGESEFVITLLGAMAQEESANLSKRVKFGKDINAKKGRVPREILGYDKVDNFTLKINEEEAALVRRIYNMYLSGMCGMAHIATVLRGEQIRTKKGCAYTEGYIRRILTNPIYCGELVNHKTVTLDFINGTQRRLPEEEQYRHNRPELAIVSKEMFEKVQRIRVERCKMQTDNGHDPRRRYTSRYLLSGVVRCAECGRTMFRQNNSRANGIVDSYWRCPSGTRMKNDDRCTNHVFIRNDVLEKALSEALTQCVGDKAGFAEAVQEQMKANQNTERSADEEIAEKQDAMERLVKQKQKYIEMCSNEIITMDELKQYTARISEQIEQLNRDVAILRRDCELAKHANQNIESCISEIETFLSLKNAKNCDVKRFLSRIDVGLDRTVTFVFRVNPEQN